MDAEQCRAIVEQRFKKYKEKKLQTPSPFPLAQRDTNIDSHEQAKDDKMAEMFLTANQSDVLELMMSDPTIQALHQDLRKKSEQQNKEALMNNFPKRYQTLLAKELAYHKMEENLRRSLVEEKEKDAWHQQTINQLKRLLEERDEQLSISQHKLKNQKQLCDHQLLQKVTRKEAEIFELQEVHQKYERLKEDYRNGSRIITELREVEDQKNRQIERLVLKIQSLEDKLSAAHRRLIAKDSEKVQEINQIRREFQNKVQALEEQKQQSEIILQQQRTQLEFKDSLIEVLEQQKEGILEKYDIEMGNKHDELQTLRQQYLESLTTIDSLEEKMGADSQKNHQQIQLKQTQISHLRKAVDNLTVSYSELAARYEATQKLMKTKDQTVDSLDKELQMTKNIEHQLRQELVIYTQKINRQEAQLQQTRQILHQKIANQQERETQKTRSDSSYEQRIQKFQDYCREQQKIIKQLQAKVEQWLFMNQGPQEMSLQLKKYEVMVEKLKEQILQTKKVSRVESERQVGQYQILAEENKELRKKLIRSGFSDLL